jgi:hypothetical protein
MLFFLFSRLSWIQGLGLASQRSTTWAMSLALCFYFFWFRGRVSVTLPELASNSYPVTSTSQVAGIMGIWYHDWLFFLLICEKYLYILKMNLLLASFNIYSIILSTYLSICLPIIYLSNLSIFYLVAFPFTVSLASFDKQKFLF